MNQRDWIALLCLFCCLLVGINGHRAHYHGHFDDVENPQGECPQHIGPPCPRYYVNDMKDYSPGDSISISPELLKNMTTMSEVYINIFLKNAPPEMYDYFDIMSGTAGRALMFLRLFRNNPDQPKYLNLARQYIDNALQHMERTGEVGFMNSFVGVLTTAALVYHLQGDINQTRYFINEVQKVFDDPNCLDDTYDTGKAGLLMSGFFLDNYFGPGTIKQTSKVQIAYQILEDAIQEQDGHLAWKNTVFPDIIFWGQGHGSTGVIQQFFEIPEILRNSSVLTLIKNTLDYFLTIQLPDGNFPTPQQSPYPLEPDVLVQWCHGSPGFIPVLLKAYELFNDSKYLAAAEKAADNVWERGILTKGLMLCHGISGNTYMFLYLHRITNNPKYFYRALKFQEYVLSHPIVSDPSIMRIPSPSPYMFYVGSYGPAVVLWSDLITSLKRQMVYRMPAFEPYI